MMLSNYVNKIIVLFLLFGIISFFYLGLQKTEGRWGEVESVCAECRSYEWSFWNMFSEYKLVQFGINVSEVLQVTLDQRNFLRSSVLQDYNEMSRDTRFQSLPKQIGKNFSSYNGSVHYFAYVPHNYTQDKLVVFLHGSAGNFQWYLWKMKDIAEENNAIVIVPTFLDGNWYKSGGVQTIGFSLEDAKIRYQLENSKVTLIALSNGGTGATRVIQNDDTDIVQNVVFLSAHIEKNIVDSKEFQKNIINKKSIIIHGENDDRVLVTEIKKILPGLPESTQTYFMNADHFLFIERYNDVKTIIGKILQ